MWSLNWIRTETLFIFGSVTCSVSVSCRCELANICVSVTGVVLARSPKDPILPGVQIHLEVFRFQIGSELIPSKWRKESQIAKNSLIWWVETVAVCLFRVWRSLSADGCHLIMCSCVLSLPGVGKIIIQMPIKNTLLSALDKLKRNVFYYIFISNHGGIAFTESLVMNIFRERKFEVLKRPPPQKKTLAYFF